MLIYWVFADLDLVFFKKIDKGMTYTSQVQGKSGDWIETKFCEEISTRTVTWDWLGSRQSTSNFRSSRYQFKDDFEELYPSKCDQSIDSEKWSSHWLMLPFNCYQHNNTQTIHLNKKNSLHFQTTFLLASEFGNASRSTVQWLFSRVCLFIHYLRNKF